MTEARYSAIVLYHRAGPRVWDTVRSLVRQAHAPEQIIVVDNASGDSVCESVPDDLKITLVTSEVNLGYLRGLWLGTQHVNPDSQWALYVTHEVTLAEDCAEELIKAAKFFGAAQVGPTVSLHESDELWSMGGGFNRWGNTTHSRASATTPKTVDWLEGCCHLVRLDLAVDDVFDPDYFLYWDDVDLSARLAQKGPVLAVPSAHCWQDTGGQPIYFAIRNRLLFWRKRRRPLMVTFAIADAVLRLLLEISSARRSGRMRALRQGMRDGLAGSFTNDWTTLA